METTSFRRRVRALFVGLVLAIAARGVTAASDHYGQVTFAGQPVPGATVTATQGEQTVVAVTNEQGVYRLPALADGPWTVRVELLGFFPEAREVVIAADAPPAAWALTLLSFEAIVRSLPPTSDAGTTATGSRGPDAGPVQARSGSGAQASAPGSGFQRAAVNPAAAPAPVADTAAPPAAPAEDTPAGALGMGAADGLLVNGSVNNGAATPFAQFPAFGNNRRRPGSVYNGGVGLLTGNSLWDARPYSFSGEQTPKDSYYDVHLLATFGGPLRIPGVVRNNPILFVGGQRTSDHTAMTQSAIMPTALERVGDFSQSRDAFGQAVRIVDPVTGVPFPGGVIPQDRISPEAASLLGYYPAADAASGRFNYQTPLPSAATQYSLQSRITQPVNTRNQLFGTFAYQRTTTDTTSLFGFDDRRQLSAFDAAANWTHRLSQFLSVRSRYQLTRSTTSVTPYFAGRTNVSGDAGIGGNNQEPENWGPPALVFSSGVAGLADVQPAHTRVQTHAWSGEVLSSRGRHYVTAGGVVRRHQIDINAQQDPRGMFSFTGAATGSDLADFLLGLPQTSAIAFGNADKYLRAFSYDAYVNDDFRVSPGLTINAGLRWEYEAPLAERFGRLVNLDVAPGFTAVAPVVATDPVGPLSGRRYPESLLVPDRRGVQPRLGLAWRPVAGSSLVVRAGYGIYRNTGVYQSIATLLAQQPPLSTTSSVQTNPVTPLTLANGFLAPARGAANTFAVDPDFRVGFAHSWQASLQRDLPASLTVIGSYLGTHGRHLMQEVLPNTYPAGAAPLCVGCPSGFIYLTSSGASSRHAGQVQLRRRLRNGLMASAQYTLSKAEDDAAAFSGASLAGATIAQDWLDLDAEWSPSAFDQRHLLNLQFQYTTGVGVSGGTLLDGLRGALWKGWTVTSELIAGSGTPLTPVYLTPVRGTGVSGTIRPDVVGVAETPDGAYLNPANFAPPALGQWGSAGRNSVRGPKQFALNAGVTRTFSIGDRFSLDWRIDVTNILNRVTYSGVNMLFGSPQFGQADRANQMRKLQSSLRLRY